MSCYGTAACFVHRESLDQTQRLQVAANPDVIYVSEADVDEDFKAAELEAEMQKEDLLAKPENIRPNIAQGRVNKTIGKRCLMNQEYIKDPSKTVEAVVQVRAAL